MLDLNKITFEFIHAVEVANYQKMQQIMTKNVRSFITNAEAGVSLLKGRDAFIQNIQALNIETVKPKIKITQLTTIKNKQVMVMVEIKARRKKRSLHNYATYLLIFANGLIKELHMVEAFPAYSDEFWKK